MREGLFDQSLKKPIPMCARNVGIVTSPTGAVVHDIQTVAARRDPTVRLTLCPVNVQGGAAAGEIARAIARMDRLDFDVLIVGRGGGSIEDLWAFNEEVVARAIFACKTPVISAVGHEVDFTIADFVSDVRAATPSVAAELAIADRGEIERMLDMRLSQLNRALGSMLDRYDARIERAKSRLETLGPRGRLDVCAARLDALGMPYVVNPTIVRGLDYYTRTVFEFVSESIGAQGTVCGGGRYDGLIEEMGGASVPGVGFALGLERLLLLMRQTGVAIPEKRPFLYVAPLGEEARAAAFRLTQELREAGVSAETDHMNRSVKAQFKYADKLRVRFVAVLGADELSRGEIKLRDMENGGEENVPLAEFVSLCSSRAK